MSRNHRRTPLFFLIAVVAALSVAAFGQGGRGGGRGGRGGRSGGPPQTPEQAAPLDLTGYWVSLVTEDWRYRMVTPAKGDYASVPINPAGRALADQWDPDKDIAAGQQCKAYGAAALMRVPTRLHITWADQNTLKIETDAGTQTRLLHFGTPTAPSSDSLQGFSVADWDGIPRGRGFGLGFGPGGPGGGGGGRGGAGNAAPAAGGAGGAGGLGGAVANAGTPVGVVPTDFNAPTPGATGRASNIRPGSLKVVTTNLSPGYLRKNGVPYGSKTTLTEYFDRTYEPNGDSLLIVTTIVTDPEYLTGDFITSTHFKKLADSGPGWNPTPCEAK